SDPAEPAADAVADRIAPDGAEEAPDKTVLEDGSASDAVERLRTMPFSSAPPSVAARADAPREPSKSRTPNQLPLFGLALLVTLAASGAAYFLRPSPETPTHPPDVNVPSPKPPEVDDPAVRYRRLVDFIRAYPEKDCFIALPTRVGDHAVMVQTFARDGAQV